MDRPVSRVGPSHLLYWSTTPGWIKLVPLKYPIPYSCERRHLVKCLLGKEGKDLWRRLWGVSEEHAVFMHHSVSPHWPPHPWRKPRSWCMQGKTPSPQFPKKMGGAPHWDFLKISTLGLLLGLELGPSGHGVSRSPGLLPLSLCSLRVG